MKTLTAGMLVLLAAVAGAEEKTIAGISWGSGLEEATNQGKPVFFLRMLGKLDGGS